MLLPSVIPGVAGSLPVAAPKGAGKISSTFEYLDDREILSYIARMGYVNHGW
jgi:hypothetical protein